ncbi:unnamed protein product [Schistocephalus solidus]|uniref:Uncharacterized protein n=1 Tax=Schistocephalus solidus TaxID=70667 RepID=A0A183TT34_SCHSO|nr:unnamed protein product [Schistocephalus solidus]
MVGRRDLDHSLNHMSGSATSSLTPCTRTRSSRAQPNNATSYVHCPVTPVFTGYLLTLPPPPPPPPPDNPQAAGGQQQQRSSSRTKGGKRAHLAGSRQARHPTAISCALRPRGVTDMKTLTVTGFHGILGDLKRSYAAVATATTSAITPSKSVPCKPHPSPLLSFMADHLICRLPEDNGSPDGVGGDGGSGGGGGGGVTAYVHRKPHLK